MKVLLDIKDAKADFVMELLNSFSFVKAEQLTSKKALKKQEVLSDLKEAIENLRLVKEGKMQAQDARKLVDEL